ncbi:MAG: cation diffusion facilitator family transporter [Cardiobacteriaceae bacterium]|nr:cation diffusion facilitator family transporter [Cardiobacteriaceae bacterium]
MSHHHHDHAHHHGHHHHDGNTHALRVAFAVISAFMLVEALGGWFTGSLALLSDAGHMFSDAFALGIALFAFRVAARQTTLAKTFGYRRVEVVIALANGLTLIAIAAFIIIEAIARLRNPGEIATLGMLTIALAGLLVNVFVAWYLLKNSDTEGNLNMRGAYLHVLSDLLGSVAAIVAALLMLAFGWQWADPLASVVVAVLVGRSGWQIARKTLHILLEGTPENLDPAAILDLIHSQPGVHGVHHLHLWTITSNQHALSCHIVVDGELRVRDSEALLYALEARLREENIIHITIQVESERHPHDNNVLCDGGAEHHAH